MNVIKITIILFFILSANINALNDFKNDFNIGLGLKYGKNTEIRHEVYFFPMLIYRYFFKSEVKEHDIYFTPKEYDGRYQSKPLKQTVMEKAYFIDAFMQMKLSDNENYEKFMTLERDFLDIYLGMGKLIHLRKRIYMTFYGGGNFYIENNIKKFDEKYASPDLKMKYESKEHSFLDYGFYAGFETLFFTSKTRIRNVFTVSLAFTFNRKFVLNENYLISSLNLGFKF